MFFFSFFSPIGRKEIYYKVNPMNLNIMYTNVDQYALYFVCVIQ